VAKVCLIPGLKEFIEQLKVRFDPERVILFGSRAYGNPTEESDIDLLVLMRTRRPVHAAAEMVGEARLGVPLDVVVMTPEAFEKALKEGYLFETKVARQGIVLYEKAESPKEESPLKGRTLEWLAFGDADLEAAEVLRRQPKPYWNLICFLGQQAAEKYLKAFLEERGIEPPKTHSLALLLDLAGEGLKELLPLREDLEKLTEFAVTARYPGSSADPGAAGHAVRMARLVGLEVKKVLGLGPEPAA